MRNSPAREGPPGSLRGPPGEEPAGGYPPLPETSQKHGTSHCRSVRPLRVIRPQRHCTNSQGKETVERHNGRVTGHRKPDARRSDAATPARAFSSGTRRSLAWATRPRREHAIKLWSKRFMIHLTTRQKKRKRRPLPSLPHVRTIPLTADTPVLRDRAATRSHALMASSEPR